MSATHKIKAFAINVKSNEYRRHNILSQQENFGMDIHIFDAITPQTIDDQPEKYCSGKARRFTGRDLLPTEIACCLSHITLWKRLIQDTDHDYYIILEDDITIHHNFADILKKLSLENIDFLKFSGQQHRPHIHLQQIDDMHCLHKFAYGPLDAAAYLISKDGARKLYDYCKTMHSPIDILMDRSYSHGADVYGIFPYPAHTQWCTDEDDPLCSDIGARDTGKYAKDISPFTKSCVITQRFLGSLQRKIAAKKLHKTKANNDRCFYAE